MYCALIGDMIDSRLLDNRNPIQKKYVDTLQEINEKFSSSIAADFKVREGDGFHGLLNTPKDLMQIIMIIRLALIPAKIRIGIGIGDITTEIKKLETQEIDGPAFVTARNAMDFARIQEKKYESISQNTIIGIDKYPMTNYGLQSEAEQVMDLINLNFCMCSMIESSWSEKQAEAIQFKTQGLTQREIAKHLKIYQSSVAGRLKSSDYYTYKYCTNQIQSHIDKLWGFEKCQTY
jgi:hypothetical protein